MNAPAPYIRRVYYYETDQMAIVHHSNYIRWLEEARLDYMAQVGLDYGQMENAGIIMPVVSVNCRYLVSARYGQTVHIFSRLTGFNGVRASFCYRVCLPDGTVLATAESEHCFLDRQSRRPINLKRRSPSFSETCLLALNAPGGKDTK